jgi:hypothetical protein
MANTKRIGSIAALALFSVLSLPGSSGAQSGDVYGVGVESWSSYDYGNNGPVLVSWGDNVPAFFSFSYSALDNYGDYYVSMGIGGGPWGAGLSGIIYDSPLPYPSASIGIFEPDYDVVASYFTDGVNTVAEIDQFSGYGYSFTSFQTVPEPSAIVPAATAVLMILMLAWLRGFRARPLSGLSQVATIDAA